MTDAESTARRHKQLIREMIAGYAVAGEIIEQEKIGWLQTLSAVESWATFEGLVAFGRQLQGDPTSLHVFEQRRLEDHLYIRQVFERLARVQGLI